MKRTAFTMIELIFIIVILGILAAVAIPRLSATRKDANIAKSAMDAATAVHDMGTYYTSQSHFSYDADSMTNVPLLPESGGSGTIAPNATARWSYLTDGDNCVDFNVTGDGNVSVIAGDTSSTLCMDIQNAIDSLISNSPHIYGGQAAKF